MEVTVVEDRSPPWKILWSASVLPKKYIFYMEDHLAILLTIDNLGARGLNLGQT